MVESGPVNRITGNIDSLFATNYAADKFTFYNKRGLTCESKSFPSLRYISSHFACFLFLCNPFYFILE